MTHDEAIELSGLYVLDALSPAEREAVDAHLRACTLEHAEFAELGGVTPALATLAAPVAAPRELKARVLDAYRSDMGAPQPALPAPAAQPRMRPDSVSQVPGHTAAWRMPTWAGWATAVAAVLILAVVGVWAVGQGNQADLANRRAQQLAQAVAAMAAPGSQVAILHGSGTAQGARGFAAFPQSGGGFVVLTDLPAAPSGMTYQGWYIVGGKASSAGVMDVGPDGELIGSGMQPMAGTDIVAFTLEPTGGSVQPTSAPIITGNLTTSS
jgi:hypothetical protein